MINIKKKLIYQDLQLYLIILLTKEKTMNELYESVDYNNLNFEYVGPTTNICFYKYMDSKELFNAIKSNQLKLDDALKRQTELLNKINDVKLVKKLINKKK